MTSGSSKRRPKPKAPGKRKRPDGPPPGGLVDHPPIIITGGSADIVFGNHAYTNSGDNEIGHPNLRLEHVRFVGGDHGDGSGDLCRNVADLDDCLIRIRCSRSGHSDNEIRITGGRNRAPVINFNHDDDEYKQVNEPDTRKRRHRSGQRKIVKLEIFRVVGGQPQPPPLHDCPLIPPNGRCEFEILDPHP